jgi:hypothetical protein
MTLCTVSATDGDTLMPSTNDTLLLTVIAPETNAITAAPLYQASGSMAKGNSLVIK